jgi:hypothetical protein
MTTTANGITITGSLARGLVDLRALLSESSTFQARVGKSADGLIRDHIAFGEWAITTGLAQPGEVLTDQIDTLAVLVEERHMYRQYGDGANPNLGAGGGIVAVFRATPRFLNDESTSHLDFVNFVSTVIDEMGTNQATLTREAIVFSDVSIYLPPTRSDLARRASEDAYLAMYIFNWEVK